MLLSQSHPCDDHGGEFAEFSTPTERKELWNFGREGAFFKAIEDESVFEAEVEVILKRAFKIDLRLGLVAQGETTLRVGRHVA